MTSKIVKRFKSIFGKGAGEAAETGAKEGAETTGKKGITINNNIQGGGGQGGNFITRNPLTTALFGYGAYDLYQDGQIDASPTGGYLNTVEMLFNLIPGLMPLLVLMLIFFLLK